MTQTPTTLTEAIRYYSDAQTCINAGRAESLLAGQAEALEVLLLPQAIQRQGGDNFRGLAPRSRCLAHRSVDALQLP